MYGEHVVDYIVGKVSARLQSEGLRYEDVDFTVYLDDENIVVEYKTK